MKSIMVKIFQIRLKGYSMKKWLIALFVISALVFSGCGGSDSSSASDTNTLSSTTKKVGEYNIENLFLINEDRRGAIVSSSVIPASVTLSSVISNDQNFFNIFIQDAFRGSLKMETSLIFRDNELVAIVPIGNTRCNADSKAPFPSTADINDTASLSKYTCSDGTTLENVQWTLFASGEEEKVVVFKLSYDLMSIVGRLSNKLSNSYYIKNNEIDIAILGVKFPNDEDKDYISTIFSKEE